MFQVFLHKFGKVEGFFARWIDCAESWNVELDLDRELLCRVGLQYSHIVLIIMSIEHLEVV